ncbi:hypothetical protein [Sphingomonas sp. 3-13AW]|uniref:hypothetical protein n=1 Tax=Sphingomonas sp. 3-13AW TaxID=3050450 RepID=UPI003BB7310C
MFNKPVLDLPRTAPNAEPINVELAENEASFDVFGDEFIDIDEDPQDLDFPLRSERGPSVRAPIYGAPESRPERTLPQAVRKQVSTPPVSNPNSDEGADPFAALMAKFNG